MDTGTFVILTVGVLLYGCLQLRTSNGAPVGKAKANNTSKQTNSTSKNNSKGTNDKNSNINYHYYHDYGNHDYDGGKHPGHHEYDGDDDLFSHVKTNLTHNKDHTNIYHEYINYGFSQHGHETSNNTGGGIIDKVNKLLGNCAQSSSLSALTLIPLVVIPVRVYLIEA